MGVSEFCKFGYGIVPGLAYYTGIVFEVHDYKGRAASGVRGGRYDNLLKDSMAGCPGDGDGMGRLRVGDTAQRQRPHRREPAIKERLFSRRAWMRDSRKDAISLTAKLRKGKRTGDKL